MEKVIINDQIVNRIDAKVDMNDRGYHFGDGIYEVIRVFNGVLFAAEEHLERLFKSAKKVNIDIPYSKDKIINLVNTLVELNDVETGIVYFQITRGSAIRTHEFPTSKTEPVFTAFTANVEVPEKELEKGVEVITTEDVRWLRCEIKSLNLLPNVLAKQEAAEKNCYEAIFHRDEIVTEASSSNVFIVKNGVVITHPVTSQILNGITRQVVLNLCEENSIRFTKKKYSVLDLMTADEVFITSTTADVMPVIKIDNTVIGTGAPGSVTRNLQSLFREKANKDTKLVV
ncbi:D-amino-acid transaminase [Pseudogracilibacillus sp. SE30717A]|uniref:D-amino-acid transaminase n=1 Tax=Pseudogracilibacillus sp. SE30717A TaxID=3098293 RepID=UPI00300E39E0